MVMNKDKNGVSQKRYRNILRKKKILMAIAICLGIFTAGFGTYKAKASDVIDNLQYDSVTEKEAVKIALVYVEMDREAANNQQDVDTFKDNIAVSNVRSMYDFSGEVSSYIVEFSDELKQPAGYVVVGANDRFAPIVEYSYDGYMFLYEALESVKDTTEVVDEDAELNDVVLYYTGMMDYYIADDFIGENIESKDECELYNVTSETIEINLDDEKLMTTFSEETNDTEAEEAKDAYKENWKQFNKEYKKNKNDIADMTEEVNEIVYEEDNEFFNYTEYKEEELQNSIDTEIELENYKQKLYDNDDLTQKNNLGQNYFNNTNSFSNMSYSISDGCSLPKEDFPLIINPNSYESGYNDTEEVNVPQYWLSYLSYRNFASTIANVKLTGVSACNLIYYWYNRAYSEMKTDAWGTIYYEFAGLGGSSNGSMNVNNLSSGIRNYFNRKLSGIGGGATVTAVADVKLSKIKNEIEDGNPPILILRNHKYYNDNACLCLGYKTYYYQKFFIISQDKTSNYLRIADSRSNSPERYIHYALGFELDGRMDMITVNPYPDR